MHNLTPITRPASILLDTGLVEKRVIVNTAQYGQQVGKIIRIRQCSPFYGQTGAVAYIGSTDSKGWTEYQAISDLLFVEDACDCMDCGRRTSITLQCPECGCCLSCCDCQTDNLYDYEDYNEFQPVKARRFGNGYYY
jgi:hypothetical protein